MLVVYIIASVIYIAWSLINKFYNSEQQIKLETVGTITRAVELERLPGTFWDQLTKDNFRGFEAQYSIVLPANDYGKYYLIVSAGRALHRITYTRGSKYTNQTGVSIGYAFFKGEYSPRTFYIYRMNKIRLCDEEAAGYPSILRIEESLEK